jgi:hypothetical protein
MRFKEWLIVEEDIDGASEFFYKLSLYPTDADDGAEAFVDPEDVWALQQRWRIESKQGRKFHNLKDKEYNNIKFTSIKSLTMPDTGSKRWKHSEGDKPNWEVVSADDMTYLGVKKTAASPPKILPYNILDTYGLPLDSMFGDTVKERGSLPSDFDRPWRKVYENITPYIDVGPERFANGNMGVRSKYIGPDETGEKSVKDTPIADFGFDRNPYIPRKKRTKHIRSYAANTDLDRI